MIAAKPFLAEGKQEGKNMERTNKLWILDSTLRDGAQGANISFSVEDKLKVIRTLDDLGVDFIEAGNPFSNPAEMQFFQRIRGLKLEHAQIVAFGSTRRKGISADEDSNLKSLLAANTEYVAIFGKSHIRHVTDVIKATAEENLAMIGESVKFLSDHGKKVIFDAEHFFDGFKTDEEYALAALKAAHEAGAYCLCLCDTNGGIFPDEAYSITKKVTDTFPDTIVAIHSHNDGGLAVYTGTLSDTAGHWAESLVAYAQKIGRGDMDIEVDGGINAQTAPLAIAAGANVLVAGSAIFGAPDFAAAVKNLRQK